MNQLDNLKYDYIQLAKSSDTQALSDEYLFKTVGILDEKYKNLKEHHESFEGLLSNIGSDQKSIALLNYVLKRLKKKKSEINDLIDQNKLHTIEDIKQYVKHKLEAHAYPREIEFLTKMPMTDTGKIMKSKLRQMDEKNERR